MNNYSRRSINLNLLENIQINRNDIFVRWFRGLSILIIILAVLIYILKLIFIKITNDAFSIRNDTYDFPSSDNTNKNYSFFSEFLNSNNGNITNDSIFILDMKYFKDYIRLFNLTEYKISKRINKEMEYLYKLYRFNQTGVESPLLIDYSSSLPHYPLFSTENDKCFIRGEIISGMNNIINLTCVDISGIIYDDMEFFIRFSLLEKNSSEIKLFIFKEINIKYEFERKDGKHNIIFYENNDMKKNLRYCSKELQNFSKNYKNLPKNYIPVIQISWPKKNKYFCVRNLRLFYGK
jgi:hypothetical protein